MVSYSILLSDLQKMQFMKRIHNISYREVFSYWFSTLSYNKRVYSNYGIDFNGYSLIRSINIDKNYMNELVNWNTITFYFRKWPRKIDCSNSFSVDSVLRIYLFSILISK